MKNVFSNNGYYLASILLRSDSYEWELNEMILGELRENPSGSKIASPRILWSPPNRSFFLDRFFEELAHLPFSVDIINSEQVFQEQVDGYGDDRPDPVDPAGTRRVASLDIRMELGRRRFAKLFIRELPDEQLVLVSFAFESSSVRGGRWQASDLMRQESDLPRFREFLLGLMKAYPAIIGTLGFDLDVATAGVPHDAAPLETGMWLHQLNNGIRRAGNEYGFDFIIVNGAAGAREKLFVYDGIEPSGTEPDNKAGRPYYDLRLAEEMRANVERAEQAYDRMYDSRRPKDDHDDALLFLSKAIGFAADLGLEKEASRLEERYTHIHEVFHSQFRWL
jgi:hypothetical protein